MGQYTVYKISRVCPLIQTAREGLLCLYVFFCFYWTGPHERPHSSHNSTLQNKPPSKGYEGSLLNFFFFTSALVHQLIMNSTWRIARGWGSACCFAYKNATNLWMRDEQKGRCYKERTITSSFFPQYIIAVINSFMIRVSLATPTLCQNFFQGPSSALLAVVFVYSSD